MKKHKFTVPHTYTIIFFIIVCMTILTWIIPSGEFDRVLNEEGRSVVQASSYHLVESNPQGFFDLFTSPARGIIDAAETIAFVLIVGGSFGIINRTRAIEKGISKAASSLGKKEILIFPITMILFSLGGTTFGMCEETLPFYMVFIPLMMSLGYDSLTGMAIVYLGAIAGCVASTINPFSTGLAQSLAELAPGSGFVYRGIIWIVITAISIIFVTAYAHKVKKNPEKSVVHNLDVQFKSNVEIEDSKNVVFAKRDKLVLAIFILGMCVMVYGVLAKGWYTMEITMVFLVTGILAGLVGGLSESEVADSFIDGAKDLIYAALVIGFSRGILVIAQDGRIIDTILYNAANLLDGLPKPIFINLMMVVQHLLSYIVPSSSGQAALTIPIMAPLGDIMGVSRQVVVLAYQLGCGLGCYITPTSGVLMAALTMAKIPWIKYVKFVLPLMAAIFAVSIIAVTIGLTVYPV